MSRLMSDGVVQFSSLHVTDGARHECRVAVFVCMLCVWGNSWAWEWVCYWQLSPFPWAGGAAGCVGRGYTCSGLVRPRYRYTFHLRLVPSCRSASLPLGWGREPAETHRQKWNQEKNNKFLFLWCDKDAKRSDTMFYSQAKVILKTGKASNKCIHFLKG